MVPSRRGTLRGRINLNDGIFQNMATESAAGLPKLFPTGIIVTNTASDVTKVDFAYKSGSRSAIFALSGSTDGYNFNIPLQVSGFNHDLVIEASAAVKTRTLFSATTATWGRWHR